MKQLLLFLSISFITLNSGFAQWQSQTSNSSAYLTGVHFTDLTHGWIAGTGGTILKTSDGGANWKTQNSGVTDDLRSVFFINRNEGWVAGDKETILKTLDGGQTWKKDSLEPFQEVDFRDIYCIGQWCIAGGVGGDIYYTNKELNAWIPRASTSGNIHALFFNDTLNGWMAKQTSDGIKYTNNGGQSWTGPAISTADMWSVFSTSPQRAWIGNTGGSVYMTSDSGQTWDIHYSGNTSEINGIYFTSVDTGWLMQKDGSIYTSIDTGKSWQLDNAPFGDSFFGYYVLDNDHQWAVGSGGQIYASFDASQIVSSGASTNPKPQITINPNPLTTNSTLDIFSPGKTETFLITIMTTKGTIIWEGVQQVKGEKSIPLNDQMTRALKSPGTYFCRVSWSQNHLTLPIIIN